MDSVPKEEIPGGESVRIRKERLTCSDLEKVFSLGDSNLNTRWKRQDFGYFLAHECSYCYGGFVGAKNKELASMVLGLLVQNDLDIASLATQGRWQRHGFARELVQSVIQADKVHRAFLEVACDNLAAIGLYEGLGFKITEKLRGYYRGVGDAFRMSLIK